MTVEYLKLLSAAQLISVTGFVDLVLNQSVVDNNLWTEVIGLK